jgi:signal transduction histidine kinase
MSAEPARDLDAFSSELSHDLRTPLRAIEGFSDLLLQDYGGLLDARGLDYLGRIRAASQSMARLIDGLLTLSEMAHAELSRTAVDLSALAHSVAGELRRSAPQRAVDFVIAGGLRADGDEPLLRVLLGHLFDNAWKFTAPRERGLIEFAGQGQSAREAVFFVRDNGVGFDQAHAHKLFSAFQRLHSAQEFPGTGIGLAAVHRIALRHGGRVWAEGVVGRGATVYFTIGQTGAY